MSTQLNSARYLGWLDRHWKGMPRPAVLFDASTPWSGYFEWPRDRADPLRLGRVEVQIPFGAVVLGAAPTVSTLAHEWRHAFQLYRRGRLFSPSLKEGVGHFDCPMELDALIFELSVSRPDEIASWYAEKLRILRRPRLESIDFFQAAVLEAP